jgi:TonB family protein
MLKKKISVSKRRSSGSRDFVSFAISAAIHVGFVLIIALIPARVRKTYDTVDLSVETKKPIPESEPEIEPEEIEPEAPEPEKEKPKRRAKPTEPEPPPVLPPDVEEVPEEAPEAPPVFDLGDNTFAKGNGQSTGWTLRTSKGNTKFAAVAKEGQPPVRDTKPTGDPNGTPGGTGKHLVPIANLSRPPMPKTSVAQPPYPTEARREGVEGVVLLQVFIDRSGRVFKARVIKEPGRGLGQIAQKYMLKEKWIPALDKKGNPVSTVITYKYHFVLEG